MIENQHPCAVAAIATTENWPAVFALANSLLHQGKRVTLVTEPGDTGLPPGAFVIPLSTRFDPWFGHDLTSTEVTGAARELGVALQDVPEGTGLVTMPLRLLRAGIYGGGGAPYNQAAVLAACGFPLRFLSDAEVRAGALNDVDVFIMPGGGARSVMGQVDPLGAAGCAAIAEFVRRGGLYIGSCAGTYACIVHGDDFHERCPTQRHLRLLNARPVRSETARGRFGFFSPGVGTVVLRNEAPAHPVMFGVPAEIEIVHYNGPVLEPTPEPVVEGASAIRGLASFSGWTERFTPSEGFFGEALAREDTYLSHSIAARRSAIVVGELGLGRVVAFGPHPELGADLPMAAWSLPARMLANAVLWRCWSPGEPAASTGPTPRATSLPAGNSLALVGPLLDAVRTVTGELQARTITPPPAWLLPDRAMSSFGLPPAEIWRRALVEIEQLTADTAAVAERLRHDIAGQGPDYAAAQLAALAQIDAWVLDERASEWNQDLGYQGVRHLLTTAARLGQTALANWEIVLPPPRGAYDAVAESPYHLVGGSYLGAIGHVAAAYQLVRAMESVWANASRPVGADAALAPV